MKTQLDIENENLQIMITKGINDLQTAKESGTVSDLKISGAVIPHYVGELANGLKMYSDIVLSGRAKIKALPAKMLCLLDPLVVAHYTVKAIVNTTGSKKLNIVSISKTLASFLETEYKIQLLESKNKDDAKKFVDYIQSTNYVNKRQITLTKNMLDKFHKDVNSTQLSFFKLAKKAIVILASTKPVVKNQIMPPICYVSETQGVETKVEIATWFKEWLSEMITKDDGLVLPEYHTPLIEKPIPWTGFYGGGFHSPRFKYPLLKTEVDREEFKGIKPQRTLDALNRLQETPWKVNKKILDVMIAVSSNNLGWGDLPTTYYAKEHLTPCPHTDISNQFLTEEQKAERKLWRSQAAPHYAEQESRNSKVLAVKRVLIEANRFKEYDSIYFAYFLDFRGRIYPKASNLQPQGTDFVKSLLQFSEGKPVNTYEAEKYFFMQGANSFGNGLDKKTLLEKRTWILENKHEIIASAKNPYDLNGIWHHADEDPWLFLAFCFEFKEYMEQDYTNQTFLSHLPIAFDGSCNGLQHLSAMLLDERGGEAVNLTSKPVKQDIYDTVRAKTIELLQAKLEPLADELVNFGITRKACKRPVMIVPYAGTMRACRRYIDEQFTKEGGKEIFKDNYMEALGLYTETVWEAIGEVIIKGREIMNFLSSLAREVIGKDGANTITWTTPNGFVVKQKRVKSKSIAIKTPLGNDIKSKGYIQNMVNVYTEETDARRHATAIAPNIVHSFDSCHLQETVNNMAEGTSFAMIHDSYGTHAADAGELSKVLRQVFYDMYNDGTILDKLINEQGFIPQDFEKYPSKGNLDLGLVLEDEFFFS